MRIGLVKFVSMLQEILTLGRSSSTNTSHGSRNWWKCPHRHEPFELPVCTYKSRVTMPAAISECTGGIVKLGDYRIHLLELRSSSPAVGLTVLTDSFMSNQQTGSWYATVVSSEASPLGRVFRSI